MANFIPSAIGGLLCCAKNRFPAKNMVIFSAQAKGKRVPDSPMTNQTIQTVKFCLYILTRESMGGVINDFDRKKQFDNAIKRHYDITGHSCSVTVTLCHYYPLFLHQNEA